MLRRTWLLLVLPVLFALIAVPAPAADVKKKLLLIGCPPDSHPPTTHEYVAGMKLLKKLLDKVDGLEVTEVEAVGAWKEGPELIERADGVVLFVTEGAKWIQADPNRLKALAKVAQRKGGLSTLHWGMGTREAAPIADFVKLFGGCHGGPDRKYVVIETDFEPEAKHPIAAGIKPIKVKDEFYYKLKFAQPDGSIQPVLRANIDGAKETVAWAWDRPEGGRSFGFSGLHFHDNWKLPEYRRLVAQGVLWSLGLPIPKDGLAVDVTEADLQLKR